ncbi:class I SAM-dependent methyltransferase [bacterium]|nr:class I SAM-dependent methyltransferase [bacterium]MDB4490356.1 class I SAM-dependent methyltransferase [bacterium]
MPDYREIYNHVVSTDARYNLAENSPGFRAVVQATGQLEMLSGRSLDIGCGVGFVLNYLAGPNFDLNVFGVDISDLAVQQAQTRMQHVPGGPSQVFVLDTQRLPFEDHFFSLITCFDVLEHLDEQDIDSTISEILRALRPGGVFLGSVSCRKSGVDDLHGDNLHRTVKSPDWWINKFEPDSAQYDGQRQQLTLWKHLPLSKRSTSASNNTTSTSAKVQLPSPSSANLYQKIYDENPWYGDAEQGRCPGVRLLPQYQDWLLEPVMDLGCGRGQTVTAIRQLGLQASGIDQIENNPEMQVGDITQPIENLEMFASVVCVDCIEHLYDDQVAGLFENFKKVKRQAFSIHNGESTGTGQELHVNRKNFDDWHVLISKHFEIIKTIPITGEQMLYLTQSIGIDTKTG